MALSLSAAVRYPHACLCFVASMLVAGGGYAAENLPDPTRPPAAASMPISSTGIPEPTGSVLQSVILSSGKARATISGKEVQVGDKVDGAKVIAIREGEVTLRNGKEMKV